MARITRSTVKKNTILSSLPNSSPSSRRRVRRPQAAVAGPKRQPPKKQPSYRSQGTQTDLPVLENTQDPPTVLSTGDRVDSIVARLHDFRWSFATFIEHYVTASSSSSTDTPDRRAKRLWRAIFENPNVEQRLLLHGGQQLGRLHQEPLCRQIKRELEALKCIYAWWGRMALSQFNRGEPVDQLAFDQITSDSQRMAMELSFGCNSPLSAIDSL